MIFVCVFNALGNPLHESILSYDWKISMMFSSVTFQCTWQQRPIDSERKKTFVQLFKRHSRSIKIFYLHSSYFSVYVSRVNSFVLVYSTNIYIHKERGWFSEMQIFILAQKLYLKRCMIMHGHTFSFTRLMYSTSQTPDHFYRLSDDGLLYIHFSLDI